MKLALAHRTTEPPTEEELEEDYQRLLHDDLTTEELFAIHARATASSRARLARMTGLKREKLAEELAESDEEISRLQRIWQCLTSRYGKNSPSPSLPIGNA
jgi:DNA gyrase/topoisomerase IV subunit A